MNREEKQKRFSKTAKEIMNKESSIIEGFIELQLIKVEELERRIFVLTNQLDEAVLANKSIIYSNEGLNNLVLENGRKYRKESENYYNNMDQYEKIITKLAKTNKDLLLSQLDNINVTASSNYDLYIFKEKLLKIIKENK